MQDEGAAYVAHAMFDYERSTEKEPFYLCLTGACVSNLCVLSAMISTLH